MSTRRWTVVVADAELFAVFVSGFDAEVVTGWVMVLPLASAGSVASTRRKFPVVELGTPRSH
jgi:hypothetical protein